MGMDHVIPPVPKWIRILRYVELVVSFLYIGCIAGSLVLISPYVFNGQAVGLFSASWSLVGLIGVVITTTCAKGGYLKWFHLAWEALATLFWLVALGDTAVLAGDWASLTNGSRYGLYDHDYSKDSGVQAEFGLLAGAAFLAGIQWVFFMLTLIFFSIGCHHCRMGRVDENGKLVKGGVAKVKHAQPDSSMVDVHAGIPSGEHLPGTQPMVQPGGYYVPQATPQPNNHLPAGLA